jgi:hypothetical protein
LAIWIGGGESDGDGTDDVQTYKPKDDSWSTLTPSGVFRDRVFHAGAFNPELDVAVIHGGTDKCRADGSDEDGDCTAGNFGTTFLVFDPMGGTPKWEVGPTGGPGQVFGHTLVYDPAGKRMIAFGGSRDGNRMENNVHQLDMSDPDFSKASWSRLTIDGTPPTARFLHSAAYDSGRNWMVVYGGVTRSAFSDRENADGSTHILDLNQTPPKWISSGGATLGDRVGGTMGYDANHNVVAHHGGRRQFRTDNQNVSRESHWLACSGVQTPTPTRTPTRTATPTTEPGTPTVTPTPTQEVTQPPTDTPTPVTPTTTPTPQATHSPTATETADESYNYLPYAVK